MKKSALCFVLVWGGMVAQTPKPPVPAAKPAVRKAPAPSGVDTIIALVKGGMSESLVIRTIQSGGKAYQLSPEDMLKLQKAGVSENIVQAMLDPTGAPARAAVPAPKSSAPAAAVNAASLQQASTAYPPDLPNVQRGVRKRKVAVMPFNYAAVATWVQYWFHNDVNIGEGIRAMLTTRMAQAKNVTLVERGQLAAIQSELNLNKNAGAVNQGTKVKTGKISGADCILMGDITIFGRDDKAQASHESSYGQVSRAFSRHLPGWSQQLNSMGTFSKEEKAVVGIAMRIVDTETSEILESAEARGESSRQSKNWTSFTAGNGTYQSNSGAMESSNYQATIIGEATSAAVDKVVALLEERVPQIPVRSRAIEGRVAKISGNNPIVGFGSNEGVAIGDRFEIFKILSEVIDPNTKQVLDVETAKAGELVVTSVRDQISTGNYGGEALSETYQKGYTARLVVK